MFDTYYKKLRYSQKLNNRSLVECIKVIENNRKDVLSRIKGEMIHCHQGCNLCCHFLNIMITPLDSYVLLRIFETIPYDELFPYYKKCAEKRIQVQEYIDSLPDDENCNYSRDAYNKFGFTTQTCPFVDDKNGCVIYGFRPHTCFMYFSSVPCKILTNPNFGDEQYPKYNLFKDRAENVILMGLDNDSKSFYFDDDILGTYNKFNNLEKTIKQDFDLECHLLHTVGYEMLAILSIALEKQNSERYANDTKGLNPILLACIDGEMKYL